MSCLQKWAPRLPSHTAIPLAQRKLLLCSDWQAHSSSRSVPLCYLSLQEISCEHSPTYSSHIHSLRPSINSALPVGASWNIMSRWTLLFPELSSLFAINAVLSYNALNSTPTTRLQIFEHRETIWHLPNNCWINAWVVDLCIRNW